MRVTGAERIRTVREIIRERGEIEVKNAPNLKHLPKDKFTEAIIFAGTDAYAHAQHWIESEGRKHGDNVPPVYPGPKQLADLGEYPHCRR